MSYSLENTIEQEIYGFLTAQDIEEEELPQRIKEQILRGSVYAEFPTAKDGSYRLVLFRLASPVTMREEVFLGSILLNSFLSQNVLLACQGKQMGHIAMVANDLENFYYLWYTDETLDKLLEIYRQQLENNLLDLYLGPQNEEKGIHGDIYKLFDFHKNNIEAFPIFAMPRAYVPELGEIARKLLLQRINDFDFHSQANPTKITANMAFFLSREGNEFQSPYVLIARMTGRYGSKTGITVRELSRAFNISDTYDLSTKTGETACAKDIKENLSKAKYSPDRTKALFTEIVNIGDKLAKNEPDEWDMKYARDKALELSPAELIDELLGQCQMGYLMLGDHKEDAKGIYCRCCGANVAELKENHIIMGEDVGKYHNQFVNHDADTDTKICIKCCVQSYLALRVTGNIAGSLAFVPCQSSMIFHFGDHTDADIKNIAALLKQVFTLVKARKANKRILYELRTKKNEMVKKLDSTKSSRKQNELQEQLNEVDEALQRAMNEDAAYVELLKQQLKYKIDPDTDPAIDVFSEADIDIDIPENYVFGIGLGNYRLMAFILPEFRNYDNKKSHDFVQQKFNNSKITNITVLAFLRKLCGCNGPYYYMTLPALDERNFSTDTFYVHDKEYSAEEVMEYFELFTEFSGQVMKRGRDNNLVRKMILAERMLYDPLITLSEVMRHSRALSMDNADKYHVIIDPISRQPDLNKYLYLYLKSRDFEISNNKEMK
jgi:hypothetical protein